MGLGNVGGDRGCDLNTHHLLALCVANVNETKRCRNIPQENPSLRYQLKRRDSLIDRSDHH